MEKDKEKIEEEINENNATQDVDDFKDDKLDETHSENNEEDSDSEEEDTKETEEDILKEEIKTLKEEKLEFWLKWKTSVKDLSGKKLTQ